MATDHLETIFRELGVKLPEPAAAPSAAIASENPSTGQPLGRVPLSSWSEADAAVKASVACFAELRQRPGPARGELVRRMGERLRVFKEPLARLVCLEVGKGIEEARGEVQEMIDICDYATGLSRSLGGRTLMSERPGHRMFEQWHPLGPVLCITAFNFPVAVWSWNAAIAIVCGDPVIWKPSLKAPFCALAVHRLLRPVLAEAGLADAMQLVIGTDEDVAARLVADRRIPLVSATGSCAMGKKVAPVVAARMGRSLLELGGNNAIIVDASADLELATRAVVFGAAGTAGQRCTTTRRLFVERPVVAELVRRLTAAFASLGARVGDPLDPGNLVGPLIDAGAVDGYRAAIERIRAEGGEVLAGGRVLDGPGHFVAPTLVRVPDDRDFPLMAEETFAPILYVRAFEEGGLEQAIRWQNGVAQGLSSSLFSDSLRAIERFLGPDGSDCGIANVNIGTSGAEIGGAFGGEKDTGGGRESGSDAWKAYMRRQTCTINGSGALSLAQGIKWE